MMNKSKRIYLYLTIVLLINLRNPIKLYINEQLIK